MPLEGGNKGVGEHGEPILGAFTRVDSNLLAGKIAIFHPRTNTFHEAQTCFIEQVSP